MIGSKALRGSSEATSAPPADPTKAATIRGRNVRGSGRMRRTYVAALIDVPQNDASLLVAAICTTEAPGQAEQQGGELDQPATADHGVDEARRQGREDQEADDLEGEVRPAVSCTSELLDDHRVVVLGHHGAQARGRGTAATGRSTIARGVQLTVASALAVGGEDHLEDARCAPRRGCS